MLPRRYVVVFMLLKYVFGMTGAWLLNPNRRNLTILLLLILAVYI